MYGEYYISKYCTDEQSIAINGIDVNVCEADYSKTMRENLQIDFTSYIYNICLYVITQITIIIIGLSADFLEKMWNKNNNKIYFKFSLIFVASCFISFVTINYMITYEICSLPKWCHEGSHDNISPSNYYYRLESCPLYSHDLPYIYKEKFIDKTDSNVCEDSEYGCCKYYDINCIESVEYNYGYEFYNLIKNDTSSWQSPIPMKDKNGTNCPSLEKIIYKLNIDSETNYKEHFLGIFLVYIISLIVIW